MSDFASSLPVRTQNNGDVVINVADGTTETQLLAISATGAVTTVSNGSVTGGAVAPSSNLAGGQYNTSLPTLTNTQQAALQLDSSGKLLVDGSTVTQPVSGTVSVTQSTSPWIVAGNLTNNNAAPGATNVGVLPAIAETAYNTVTYTTGDQVLPVTDLHGALNQDLQAYAGTQLTGTVTAYGTAPTGNVFGVNAFITNTPTVNQGTSPWIVKDQADGPVAPGAVASFSQLAGGQYNSTPPTLTTTQQSALQLDSAGRLLVDANVTFSYDENWGTVGANTLRTAAQIGNATGAADFNFGTVGAQTLRVAGQIGNATGAADFNAGATGAQTLRVTANQGAPNTAANAWTVTLATGGVANSPTNPIFVSEADIIGTAVDNYQTDAALAKNASINMDYTVTAAKTFYTKQFWASGSGKIKLVVQYETAAGSGTFNTFWVGFNSTAGTNILIPVPTDKTQVTGAKIRMTITNLDTASQDVYSTLSGIEQ